MSYAPAIAIIGFGLNPFGRYDFGRRRRRVPVGINKALSDAGVDWSDVGSFYAVGLEVTNPEAVTEATGKSPLTLATRNVQLGEADMPWVWD